jgi:quinol monooxygenase YgiN
MTKLGLFVRLEAKPGKEATLEDFLRSALPLAQAETRTPVWYAVKFGPSSFAIFDAFANDEDRNAHLNGVIAAELMKRADELLAKAPVIEQWDALGVK